jgi:hypothetical protein
MRNNIMILLMFGMLDMAIMNVRQSVRSALMDEEEDFYKSLIQVMDILPNPDTAGYTPIDASTPQHELDEIAARGQEMDFFKAGTMELTYTKLMYPIFAKLKAMCESPTWNVIGYTPDAVEHVVEPVTNDSIGKIVENVQKLYHGIRDRAATLGITLEELYLTGVEASNKAAVCTILMSATASPVQKEAAQLYVTFLKEFDACFPNGGNLKAYEC